MKWISNLVKEVLNQTIVQLAVAYIVSTAILGFITKWIIGSSLFHTLKQEYLIPGWIIFFVSSTFLAYFLVYILKHYNARYLRTGKKNYMSYGLDWTLTPQFFMNYEDLLVSDASSEFIRSCVIGPFCPNCKVDVTDIAVGDAPFVCINGHDLKDSEAYKIFKKPGRIKQNSFEISGFWNPIKKMVYVEAQGKARKGMLR